MARKEQERIETVSEPLSSSTLNMLGVSSSDGLAPRRLFTARRGILVNYVDPFDDGLVRKPFSIRPKAFFAMATANRPMHPVARVSAFAEWIHSLYAAPSTAETLKRGRQAERKIFRKRAEMLRSETLWTNASEDWELEHNGLHIDAANCQKIMYSEIPKLRVGGVPLRANPDLIYRNCATSEVIVVELKFTRRPIPNNLWPDIWAQLWAYSKIPNIASAPAIWVVGEIWGERWQWEERRHCSYQLMAPAPRFEGIYLRALARRDPTKPSFDAFFQRLFDIYAGRSE